MVSVHVDIAAGPREEKCVGGSMYRSMLGCFIASSPVFALVSGTAMEPDHSSQGWAVCSGGEQETGTMASQGACRMLHDSALQKQKDIIVELAMIQYALTC